MKYIITLIFLIAFNPGFSQQKNTGHTYAFVNGKWFDGKVFIERTMYVHNGMFKFSKPSKIDSTINLQGKYIIPPFSEAHTHHLEGVGDPVDEVIKSYLKDGVFYIKSPNNVLYFTKTILDKVNIPQSVDASFANAGLTSTEGHPMKLFEDMIRPGIEEIVGKTERGWFNGKAYYTIDNEKDLSGKWPAILADHPNFIKTYLINSEDIENPDFTSNYKLRTGLKPSLFSKIVAKAHEKGLKVAVHVETANDFRVAITAGADEMAHMPGFYLFDSAYRKRYLLTDKDAQLAVKKKVYVVTTLLSRSLVEDKSLLPIVEENQKRNLLLLKKYKVKIAIGSDHGDSPLEEIKAIRSFTIFSNLELLKLWCESSAQYIFPNRKIGYLRDGYEASFLVLSANPLKDWSSTERIEMRFKQGFFLVGY